MTRSSFTGLESLVPEELEKHLILNSNGLRTFEDARLEVVTYVEAKFGLRIRDSKPSDTGARGHSDPMDVDAVNSLSLLPKENGHRVRVMGTFSTRLQYTHKQRQAIVWHRQTEQVMAKSEGKGKSKENKRKIQRKMHRNQ